MSYSFLSPPLHPVAENARAFLSDKWGIPKTRFAVEQKIVSGIAYGPTLSAPTADHHILCVDVSDKAYNASLDDFVLQCMHQHLPVKLFVAIPKDTIDPDYRTNLRKLSDRGVGLIEVADGHSHIVRQPLSLSLVTVSAIGLDRFPARMREHLQRAEQQFKDGSPVDGCSNILDLIEERTRNLARMASKRGWWKTPPTFNLDKVAWATLLKYMTAHLDVSTAGCNCPEFTDIFIAQLIGITASRNEVSHPPKDLHSRIRRDTRLRTRFEHGCNVLYDFIEATKGAKL
jgi:hypothetical protein